MSTRGSFIIRKGGIDKELYIPCDGYPSGAGREVVNLVKTINLRLLHELLLPSDDGMDFSASRCEDAVGNLKPYEYRRMNGYFIQDSIMCEYAYVIDTDEKKLYYYVGWQKKPQEGNRYGTDAQEGVSGDLFYPCRLYAVFSFSFIRAMETAAIVEIMKKYDSDAAGDIEIFDVPAVVINVAESLSVTPTEPISDSSTEGEVSARELSNQILGSIKALLLRGAMNVEILMELTRTYDVPIEMIREVIERMRV